jgi:Protein of unknown function (DUF3830)
MARRMEVEVAGARARFVLLDDLAPRSATALWDNLPIETTLAHGKLSGDACFFEVRSGPLMELPEQPEFGVTSIYQGYMVLSPSPARGAAELLVSYGLAESRSPTGRRYVTPVAELEGDGSGLFAALKRTHRHGEARIAVRRVEG